jgi:hypothetical protein
MLVNGHTSALSLILPLFPYIIIIIVVDLLTFQHLTAKKPAPTPVRQWDSARSGK